MIDKKKIISSKVKSYPFPYIFIKQLVEKKKLSSLNLILPSFNDLDNNDEVLFQSSSKTKKTILPNSKIYKKLYKEKIFKNFNNDLESIKPLIIKKFNSFIIKYVNKKYCRSKLNYHSSYSVMKKGYVKSSHIDRRDHLITLIFYSDSDEKYGGNIQIDKLKNPKNNFDVFPDKKNIKTIKNYKVPGGSCLIILNVPWAYHSVNKYYGSKDRKYFYCAYDFQIKKVGSLKKNRKKGFNENTFWKNEVKVQSLIRKEKFFSE